jgi:hypothetical protein
MGPACTPMRVCVCVSIVVDASGAPPPKGNGGGVMFGCYGNQHTQGRHAFMWCHGVRCPRTPRCHPTRPGSGCVNHVRCTTTATEPRRPLQQHCTCMNPRGVPPNFFFFFLRPLAFLALWLSVLLAVGHLCVARGIVRCSPVC